GADSSEPRRAAGPLLAGDGMGRGIAMPSIARSDLRSRSRTPSPVTAALYSTMRAGTYRALPPGVGAQVADANSLVLAPDRNFGELPASPEVRGVALGNLQELPDLRVVEAGILVSGKLVGLGRHDEQLASQASLHTPFDHREPTTLLA